MIKHPHESSPIAFKFHYYLFIIKHQPESLPMVFKFHYYLFIIKRQPDSFLIVLKSFLNFLFLSFYDHVGNVIIDKDQKSDSKVFSSL